MTSTPEHRLVPMTLEDRRRLKALRLELPASVWSDSAGRWLAAFDAAGVVAPHPGFAEIRDLLSTWLGRYGSPRSALVLDALKIAEAAAGGEAAPVGLRGLVEAHLRANGWEYAENQGAGGEVTLWHLDPSPLPSPPGRNIPMGWVLDWQAVKLQLDREQVEREAGSSDDA